MTVQSEKIEFPGADGQMLAARLDRAVGPAKSTALFAHCFSCSKDIFAASRIAGRLAEHGVDVMRFDFTGLGNSEGDFANTNFSSNIQDIEAALDWLHARGTPARLIIGHSLGGAAVLAAAQRRSDIKAVATLAAPSDADHVLHNFSADIEAIERDGEAEVLLAGRPFKIKKQFVDDVRAQSVRDAAAALKKPLLVMHAPLDQTVGIDNASAIFAAAKHPKSFTSLDGADHLLTRRADAFYAADVIAAWASRYAFEDGALTKKVAANTVQVTETGAGPYQNHIAWPQGADLVADEPQSLGGGNTGPDPFALVAAGLGACTSMTLRMYAERKNWPVEAISVSVLRTDAGFERTISLSGPLSDAQLERLLEISEKCPVHRMLEGASTIKTTLEATSTV